MESGAIKKNKKLCIWLIDDRDPRIKINDLVVSSKKIFFGPTKEVGLNHGGGEPVSAQPPNCSQPSFEVKTVHTHRSWTMSLPQGSLRKHLPKGPEDFCRWATRGRHQTFTDGWALPVS